MLGTNYFYWETLKKYIVAFGLIFSDIHFKRPLGEMIKVPISYGPKEKMLARLRRREENPSDKGYSIALTMPRMSFEITNIYYDSSRVLNKFNQYVKPIYGGDPSINNSNKMKYVRAGAPYNIDFELTMAAKFESDVSALLDIIIPMFKPEQMVSIFVAKNKNVPYDPNIKDWQENFNGGVDLIIDTPVILNSLSLEDSYEGDFETARILHWTLSFTMKGWLMGPSTSAAVIKLPQATIYPDGTYKYIPYTVNRNWAELTIDDADNIQWYEEFTAINND